MLRDELIDRLERLAIRREQEGIYTDRNLVWEAIEALMIQVREEDGLADRDNIEGLVEPDISDAAGTVRSVSAENVESVTPDIAGLRERYYSGHHDEAFEAALSALERLKMADEAREEAEMENIRLSEELTAAKAEIEEIRQMYVDANEALIDAKAENERLRAENNQLFEANQRLARAMTEFYNLPPSSQAQES